MWLPTRRPCTPAPRLHAVHTTPRGLPSPQLAPLPLHASTSSLYLVIGGTPCDAHATQSPTDMSTQQETLALPRIRAGQSQRDAAAEQDKGRRVKADRRGHGGYRTPRAASAPSPRSRPSTRLTRLQPQICARARPVLHRWRQRGNGERLVCYRAEEQRLFTLPLTAELQRVRARLARPSNNTDRGLASGCAGGKRRGGACFVRNRRDYATRVMPASTALPQRRAPQVDSRGKETPSIEKKRARDEESCDRFL